MQDAKHEQNQQDTIKNAHFIYPTIAFSFLFVLQSIHSAAVARHSFVEFDERQTQRNVYGVLFIG